MKDALGLLWCLIPVACSTGGSRDDASDPDAGARPNVVYQYPFSVQVNGAGSDFAELKGEAARINFRQGKDGSSIESVGFVFVGHSTTVSFGADFVLGGESGPDLSGTYELLDLLESKQSGVIRQLFAVVDDTIAYGSTAGSLDLEQGEDELSGTFGATMSNDAGEELEVTGVFSGPYWIDCWVRPSLTGIESGVVGSDADSWTIDSKFETEFCQRFKP